MHGRTDAAALAAALALVGWGRGRQAIPGGKPGWTGRPFIAGEDSAGRLVIAAGRGPEAGVAGRALATLFGLAGLHDRLMLYDADTGQSLPLGPAARGDGPAVVYMCAGSAYAALVAAAVHVGLLPADRVPRWRELRGLPKRHGLPAVPAGDAIFAGTDSSGRAVYATGLYGSAELIRRLVRRVIRRLLLGPAPLELVSAAVRQHPLTQWGSQLTRLGPLGPLGVPLAVWGVRQTYRHLAWTAAATQRELGRIKAGRLAAGVDPGQAIRHTGWQESRAPSGPQRPPNP